MTMKAELLDELLKDCKTQEDIFGANGLVKQFVKPVVERFTRRINNPFRL